MHGNDGLNEKAPILPAESNPMWRWPGSEPPRTQPTPQSTSGSSSPFTAPRTGRRAAPASPVLGSKRDKPAIQGFVARLFRNATIQGLAKADLQSQADEERSTATASRPTGVMEPPDLENATDAREARRQYARWIEAKTEARAKRRFDEQVSDNEFQCF